MPIELAEGVREGRHAYTPCPESGIQSLHLQESPWWTAAGNGQQETLVLFCFVASLGMLVKDREMPRQWGYR